MQNTAKEALRSMLRERLARISSAKVEAISRQIVEELRRVLVNEKNVFSVVIYQPVPAWGEIDVTSLPALLPNVRFEMVENIKNAPFPMGKFDVVIIPLLGFNREAYRLGHGGGWYDRFLATQPGVLKIGIGYENTLVDFSPKPYDIPMDIIITDEQIHSFCD